MRKAWMTFALLVVAAVLAPAGPRVQWKTPWSYSGASGPQHWGDLDPAYAACKGKEQSPIDIRNAKRVELPAIRFEDKNGPLRIINNGYRAVRVNYPPENGNVLVVDNKSGEKRYELTQFHFHHPSEEYVDGKPSDMAIHFMYKAGDGKVAAVAVLLEAGSANVTIQRLWKYMPKTAGKEHEIPGVDINPAGLLPRNTAYYTYMGSQTAPPCTEGVTWFVLKAPMDISAEEINAFANLYPHDARPVQPLNGRVVEESR
ncbi:MAG: carbonic anhydrase [Candidatus Acidiferrales bacterium]